MNPAEFDNIARSERRLWWYRGMNRILFRLLPAYTGDRRFRRVLEAGCGTGYLSTLLAQRNWPMYAIDLSAGGLRYAAANGLTRIAQSDLRYLPFADASFDAVLSMDVIVHLHRDKEQIAFDELARVLAPGGLMVLRVSALDALRSRHSQFVGENQRFTKKRFIECVRRAGMRVLRCTYANSLLLPVAFAKFRIWEPLTNQEPRSGVEPVHPLLDSLLYAPLAMEARLISAGVNFPLGQSILLFAEKPQ